VLALTPIAASQRRFKASRSGVGSSIGGGVRSRFNVFVFIVHQKNSSLGLGLGVGCLWSGMSGGAIANQYPQTAVRSVLLIKPKPRSFLFGSSSGVFHYY
jgi:hypothetical protein